MTRTILLALSLSALAAAPEPDYYRGKLAERRAVQLDLLHAYAMAGVFPRNLDFKNELRPYFIDAAGTPCAVAHLWIEDGGKDAAKLVAAADNHVKVADLKEGPLVDWILTSGLIQEEAAQIQPSYNFRNGKKQSSDERRRVRARLLSVEAKLRGQGKESLATAVSRLLARLKKDAAFVQKLPFPSLQ